MSLQEEVSVVLDLPNMVFVDENNEDYENSEINNGNNNNNNNNKENPLYLQLQKEMQIMETITVPSGTAAYQLCQQFIRVVVCTFCEPVQAVVMLAMLTFPEREKIEPSKLAKRMKLDLKTLKPILLGLKAQGYIIEHTKTHAFKNNYNNVRTAYYQIDYQYFIYMTKLRLHMMLQRLCERANKDNTVYDCYVCQNPNCSERFHTRKTIHLMMDGKKNNIGEFLCENCDQPLVSSNEVFDNNNSVLEVKRRFNHQIQKLRNLLFQLEKAVAEERQKLEIIQQKAEERYEQLMNGIDESAYTASTIDTSATAALRRGPEHLERLGRQRIIKPKDFNQFDSKIEINDKQGLKNMTNGDDIQQQKNSEKSLENQKKTKEELARNIPPTKEFENQLEAIKEVMIRENIKNHIPTDKKVSPEEEIIEKVTVNVKGIKHTLKYVLANMDLVQDMTNEEYEYFDRVICDLGLTLIE